MTFNKDPSLTPHAAPPPAPTTGGTTSPKLSPPSDVCSTAPYHVYVNTPIEPTEAFKNTVKDIIEAISYITASMSYEPETVLLQLAELWQELKFASSAYKFSMPYPNK